MTTLSVQTQKNATRSLNIIGTPARKVDAVSKVTGETRYAGDYAFPRMLHCKLLRSPHPYARICAINTDAAQAMSGVVAVLTGQELPTPYGVLGGSQDETALAVDKVRFVGDPVAAVAAVNEETAEAALQQITVAYEQLPPVMEMTTAVAPPLNEPLHSHAEQGNIQKRIALEFGDLDAGFAEADLIQEDLFFYGGNSHVALEAHATVAQWDPAGDLTVWSTTQTPHYLHRTLAQLLDLPPNRVRVIAPPVGGGFGGKSEPFNHELVVAKLAMITGRPVKIVLTREEVFYTHRGSSSRADARQNRCEAKTVRLPHNLLSRFWMVARMAVTVS